MAGLNKEEVSCLQANFFSGEIPEEEKVIRLRELMKLVETSKEFNLKPTKKQEKSRLKLAYLHQHAAENPQLMELLMDVYLGIIKSKSDRWFAPSCKNKLIEISQKNVQDSLIEYQKDDPISVFILGIIRDTLRLFIQEMLEENGPELINIISDFKKKIYTPKFFEHFIEVLVSNVNEEAIFQKNGIQVEIEDIIEKFDPERGKFLSFAKQRGYYYKLDVRFSKELLMDNEELMDKIDKNFNINDLLIPSHLDLIYDIIRIMDEQSNNKTTKKFFGTIIQLKYIQGLDEDEIYKHLLEKSDGQIFKRNSLNNYQTTTLKYFIYIYVNLQARSFEATPNLDDTIRMLYQEYHEKKKFYVNIDQKSMNVAENRYDLQERI